MFMPPGRPQEQPSLSNSVRRKTTTSTSSALGAKRTPSATFGGEGSLPGSTTRGTEDLLESATSQTTTMDASTVAPLTPFIVDAGQMVAARESSASTRRPRQVLRPLFHATASETTITAIECEPRSGAMAFGQSTGDVYVCPAPSADVDIASTTSAQPALVGTMPSAVKQLVWAPTRSVGPSQRSSSKLQLACCCPGRSPVVFTSAGSNGWEQETLDVPECIAVTFTDSTTPPTASSSGGGQVVLWLICICTRQRMVICQRSDEAPLARWNVLTSISLDGGVSTSTPDPPQTSEAIARGKRTNGQREFTCISAAGDGGSWVAVGDTEGTLRLFDMAMLHSSANNNKQSPTHAPLLLWTHAAMFKNSIHHQAQHGVVASDGSIRHIAWASSQGRSFTPVTYVVGTELAVVLIANAIATVLEPHVPTAAILGYRSCSVQDEVLKLAWNPSCTRITTSHADGTARVYDVTIAFRLHSGHQQPSIVTHGPHLATYDKYIVDVVEVARSVAPYTADPLANRR